MQLTQADRDLLALAVRLGDRASRSQTSYSVGAVIAAPDGRVLETGFTRELGVV